MSVCGVLLVAVALQQQPADVVVLNARVYTADVNRPVAEAVAVRGGRIAFVGSARGALALAGPADRQAAAPDVLLLRQEAARVLEQALDTLPFYERTALRLLVQQGCSYQDIAAVMDTSISTVRTRLWRACHRLRAHVVAGDAAPPRPRSSRGSAGSARRCAHQQATPGAVTPAAL